MKDTGKTTIANGLEFLKYLAEDLEAMQNEIKAIKE
jgi:hypothetical protein